MSNPRLCRFACLAICVSLTGCFGNSPPKARPEVQARTETLLMRGIRAEQRGDTLEAEKLLVESLSLSTSIEDDNAKAKANINLARLYRFRHDTINAMKSIDAALRILGPGMEIYAEAAQEKALIELSADNADSLTWAEKAVATEKGALLGRRLNLLGRIQLLRGDMTSAAGTLEKALDENRRNDHAEEEANSLRMLGIVARGQKRLADAERLLSEALEIDKRIGVGIKIATDLEELAHTARVAGNMEKSAGYLERACDVHMNGGRMAQAVTDMTTLAEVFGQMGNIQKAETVRKKAQLIAEQQKSQQPGRSPATTKPSNNP